MKVFVIICAAFIAFPAFSSKGYNSKQAYVEDWYSTAVNQMITHKIPASITLAQAILESAYGNSDLAKNANNHFGIKCADWTGAKVYQDDDAKNECFRKYTSAIASFEDHSIFLQKQRYQFLFDYDITDYKKWAKGLKTAGYATNPKYPTLLIDLIEDLELYKYDQLGITNPSDITYTPTKIPSTVKDSKTVKGANKATKKVKVQKIYSPFERTDRQIFIQPNKTKYVITKEGDTYVKIAKEFQLTLGQLYQYNDFPKGKDFLVAGDIVYLQPKGGSAKGLKEIKTTKEMSVREISQQYGVKASRIIRKNSLKSADDLVGKNRRIRL